MILNRKEFKEWEALADSDEWQLSRVIQAVKVLSEGLKKISDEGGLVYSAHIDTADKTLAKVWGEDADGA